MASENENEKRETVADILAEWRECIEAADPTAWNDTRIAGLVKTTKAQQLAYLDRIEAAWKRDEERAMEHATRHAEAVARDNCRDCVHNPKGKNFEGGNAAAMREALEFVAHMDDDSYTSYDIAVAIQKARDALSEPARNCDIYTTSKDADRAITEYCSKMAETGECAKSCPYRESEGGCAFGWLLATAAERKGEGDGRRSA